MAGSGACTRGVCVVTALPPRVPYDPELQAALAWFKSELEVGPLTLKTIPEFRARFLGNLTPIAETIGDRPIHTEERELPGPRGPIKVTILRPHHLEPGAAGVLGIHDGGMVLGTRHSEVRDLANLVEHYGVVAVTVEYRLAPEHPHPAPLDDCYATLEWMHAHADELGISADRIILRGPSAGGGLAAGMSLRARDEGGPPILAQMLLCPMLDDRNDTVSALQYTDVGLWDRSYNQTGWEALLGAACGTDAVDHYAAPARATNLVGLPPTFIEVGACEVFRDEDVAFASALWAAGVSAELHVWAGAFHGFAEISPLAPVSRAALVTRDNWFQRILAH